MDEITVTKLINGPEAFTPDNEFCLGESDVRGFFVAAGFCAHGLAGAGGIGKVMAEWILEGEPSIDVWEMDIRRFGAHYRSPSYTLKRTKEVYETYYDIRYPGHERQAGRPLRTSQRLPLARRARRRLRREVRLGARQLVRVATPPRGDESLRPRGWAGHALVARDRRRAPRHAASAPGCSTSPRSPSSRSPAPAPPSSCERLCDNDVARDVGAITYTQMLNRRGGIECDFTVTRVEEELFSIVTGTAFGNHDLSWIRRHAPRRRQRALRRRDRALGLLRAVGPARARHPRAADRRPARLPLHAHARARRRRRARARAAGHLRRRARLGAVLPDRVRRRRCGARCGRPGASTAWSPAATARSTRCAWRRATACGPPTSRPTRRRTRPASASACARTRATSSARGAARRRRSPHRAAASALPRARGPALGRARQRAGARRRRGRSGA